MVWDRDNETYRAYLDRIETRRRRLNQLRVRNRRAFDQYQQRFARMIQRSMRAAIFRRRLRNRNRIRHRRQIILQQQRQEARRRLGFGRSDGRTFLAFCRHEDFQRHQEFSIQGRSLNWQETESRARRRFSLRKNTFTVQLSNGTIEPLVDFRRGRIICDIKATSRANFFTPHQGICVIKSSGSQCAWLNRNHGQFLMCHSSRGKLWVKWINIEQCWFRDANGDPYPINRLRWDLNHLGWNYD